MPVIGPVGAPDQYNGQTAILQNVYGSKGGFFAIANNPAFVQQQYSRQGQQGSEDWTEEVELGAGANVTLSPACIGVQFRNAVAGKIATITAQLAVGDEPPLLISALGVVGTVATNLLNAAKLPVNPGSLPIVLGTGVSVPISLAAAYDFNTSLGNFPARGGSASGFEVNVAGIYRIVMQATFNNSSAAGSRLIQGRQNGVTQLPGGGDMLPTSSLQPELNIVTFASMAAGDFVEMLAFQDSGGNLNLLGGFVEMEQIG